jgi:iron complex transport system substrate-binding protein
MRIVSLLASGTELCAALGLGERLVGRSHECDHPAWVKRLPVLSRPAFDIHGTSLEIDTRVRERLHAGLPLYEVDETQLAALAPDFIITQTHCEVCAVSPGDFPPREPSEGSRTLPRRTPLGEAELGPRDLAHGVSAKLERHQVVALETGTVDGILDGFGRVAEVLGAAEAGRALVAGIRERLAAVAAVTRTLRRPRVACLEWIDPLFEMGNWGPEIVELAGGRSLLSAPGAHSSTLAFEALRDADPEAVVVAPCGFDLARTLAELPALTNRPEWRALSAVRAGNAFAADGNFYFNRSGPMLFDTPEILAEMLHPDAFPPRHEGTVWRRLTAI